MKAALAPFIVLGHVAQLSFSIMAWGLAMVQAAVFYHPYSRVWVVFLVFLPSISIVYMMKQHIKPMHQTNAPNTAINTPSDDFGSLGRST